MISEALIINSTLTELNVGCVCECRGEGTIIIIVPLIFLYENEKTTILDQKEQE